MHKLNILGIRGKVLNWIQSYLSNRRQRVILHGEKSDPRTLSAGVPQGSILGPLLFILYTNDLPDQVNCDVRLYADDSSMFKSDKNQKTIEDNLNKDLNNVTEWAEEWKVTLNPEKTECVNFTRKQGQRQPNLIMENKRIKTVDHHKHLGVTLQKNGKWGHHINEVITKCRKRLDVLRGYKYKFNRSTIETLYFSYMRPVIEYSSCVWTNCTIEQKKDIENIQLEAARIATGAIKGTPHKRLYEETKWISTYERRDRRNLITYYKLYHRLTPEYMKNMLPSKVREHTEYNLRDRHNPRVTNVKSSQHMNSFIPSMTNKWNNTDDNIKYLGGLNELKAHLRKHDKKAPPYYYIGERKYSIHHARMRMNCSLLAADLFNMKIIDSPKCECGHDWENAEHYLFECRLHAHAREILDNIDANIPRDSKTFLCGQEGLTTSMNSKIFKWVIKFIGETKRFDS